MPFPTASDMLAQAEQFSIGATALATYVEVQIRNAVRDRGATSVVLYPWDVTPVPTAEQLAVGVAALTAAPNLYRVTLQADGGFLVDWGPEPA